MPRLSILVAAVSTIASLLLTAAVGATSDARIARVAVFPVENLSGGSVPAAAVERFFVETLGSAGIHVLRNEVLEGFMARHRVRYAAGIDAATARALRDETGAEGVLLISVGTASDASPPKVTLSARLTSTAGTPTVVWADDAGAAGDDRPGFFELGVVQDYERLQTGALSRIGRSLLAFLRTGRVTEPPNSASKFAPKSVYRALTIEPERQYSVAVIPFVNLSERRNAGEILALLFARHLTAIAQFDVLDPGVVRQQLLEARVIMDGGLSISDAETVAALTGSDLVLAGRVLRYEDYEGAGGIVKVEFSTIVVERTSRRVVWSSDSSNDGGDGVRFFERGTTKTAHAMATQMVRLTTEMIAGTRR